MWQIIGHRRAVELLDRAVRADAPAHAYLFLGPARIGKTTLGIELAKALNCTGDDPPCQRCANCRKISAGTHSDVEVVAPGDATNPKSKVIKIDRIREVIHAATLLPTEGRYRVVVLDADAVQTVQASALLKTLEEPGRHVVFVLTALGADLLPDAFVSRCQLVHLGTTSIAELAGALVARTDVVPERAEELARMSGGCAGRGLELATDPALLEQEAAEIDRLQKAWFGTPFDRLVLAASAAGNETQARQTLATWSLWWRDALAVALGCDHLVAHRRRLDDLRRFAARAAPATLGRQLQAIERAADLIGRNANPRLAMEALSLDL